MSVDKGVSFVLEGIRSVISSRAIFVRALAAPVALYLLLVLLESLFTDIIIITALLAVLELALLTIIAVTTHRLVITGPESVAMTGFPTPGKREWQFFLAGFEIVFYTLPACLLLFVPVVGPILWIIAATYIASRISLILPSIAIDAPMTSKASWQATSNYQVAMFTAIVLFTLFILVCEYAISYGLNIPVLSEALGLFTSLLLISTLSSAYKHIMKALGKAMQNN